MRSDRTILHHTLPFHALSYSLFFLYYRKYTHCLECLKAILLRQYIAIVYCSTNHNNNTIFLNGNMTGPTSAIQQGLLHKI